MLTFFLPCLKDKLPRERCVRTRRPMLEPFSIEDMTRTGRVRPTAHLSVHVSSIPHLSPHVSSIPYLSLHVSLHMSSMPHLSLHVLFINSPPVPAHLPHPPPLPPTCVTAHVTYVHRSV